MKLKKLFSEKTPAKIWILDKPPAQEGKMYSITAQQYKQKFSSVYTETIVVPDNHPFLITRKKYPETILEKQIAERLNDPLQNMVIGYINDQVGYGLFATEDIPAGTILFLYSGLIDETEKLSHDAYTHIVEKPSLMAISAKNQGGLARFMQHLPTDPVAAMEMHLKNMANPFYVTQSARIQGHVDLTDDAILSKLGGIQGAISFAESISKTCLDMSKTTNSEFDQLSFRHPHIRSQIALANVRLIPIQHRGITILVAMVSTDIKKGYLIGIDYTMHYWAGNHKVPMLFDRIGGIIPPSYYTRHIDHAIDVRAHNFLNNTEVVLQQSLSWYCELIQSKGSYSLSISEEEIFISIYVLRTTLVEMYLLPQERYAKIASPSRVFDLFDSILTMVLKSGEKHQEFFSLDAYYANPAEDKDTLSAHEVDAVCTAKDVHSYCRLSYFFEHFPPTLGNKKLFLPNTREIIIQNMNPIALK